MAIPKNVSGNGGAPRGPQGIPTSNQAGLPRGLPVTRNTGADQRPPAPTSSKRPDLELPDMNFSNVPSNSSEPAFENSKMVRVREQNSGPVRNPYDAEDDQTFTSMTVDEQLAEDGFETQKQREAREREELLARAAAEQKRKPVEQPKPAVISDDDEDLPEPKASSRRTRKSAKESKKDARGQDVFIDDEKLELEPFGGKRKVRVNDLDGRKNIRQRSQIVQYITIGLVVIIVGFGVKNSFFPEKSLTADEVATIAAETANISSFPVEAGKAFASDFMKAYLTVNGDALSKEALGYYYNGTLVAADSPNRSATPSFKQSIVYGPTVYESVGLTPYSARYTIGALVKPESAKGAAPADGSTAKWTYFNVNVFYDKDSKNFSITPDSPSLVPAVEVGDPNKVPLAKELGTEVDQPIAVGLKSIVQGFIKGYAVSSPTDHASLDQYILSNSDVSLQKGLAKAFTLAGNPDDAIQYRAFSTSNPGEIKVAVTVNWRDQIGADADITKLEYKSNYVMTLQKQANDKYLVSKFAPQYFVMADQK